MSFRDYEKKPRVWTWRRWQLLLVLQHIHSPSANLAQVFQPLSNSLPLQHNFVLSMSTVLLIYLWRKIVTTTAIETKKLREWPSRGQTFHLGLQYIERRYCFQFLDSLSLSLSLHTYIRTHFNSENTRVVMFFYQFVWNIIQL